jgi:hypothetical protein
MCRNMFLHFYGKYNMILFVLKILDRMQIKIFNSFFFLTFTKHTLKKVQTHTSPFYYVLHLHLHLQVEK